MRKFTSPSSLLFCTLFLLLSATRAYSTQTYVVLDDVVFVRSDPKTVLPVEHMGIQQLENEYFKPDFPPHFFYGQNVRGDVEPGITGAVKVYGMFERKAVTGYMDNKRLWQEPPLSKPAAPTSLILLDLSVLLIPDASSRKVLPLYQGEVVETLGRLQYSGSSWIKAKFANRFGYIEEKNVQPLISSALDEASLTLNEIPKTSRNGNRVLSDRERSGLSKTGFFMESVAPLSDLTVDDMADLYQKIASPVFLTSDLYLHSFHLIFDRMLQNTEYVKLYPEILALTTRLVNEATKDLTSYHGAQEKVRKALTYNVFYFSVAAKLLDPKFLPQPDVGPDVEAVVARILEASGAMPQLKNRINPGEEDFSMYRVRGHYEAHADASSEASSAAGSNDPERLSRYFRAMMWYGRRPFLLLDDVHTLSAILVVKELETTGELKRWQNIDDILRKLVGKTDDWSPLDYKKVMDQVFGTRTRGFDDMVQDPVALKRFRDVAERTLPAPRIIDAPTGDVSQNQREKSTAGFRFLGMRFTWDAHLFGQLTHPNVPTRNLPTALDAMAVFGSSAADQLVKLSVEGQKWHGAYYDRQKKLIRAASGEIEKKETAYDSWLQTFSALFLPGESKQFFAKTGEWQYKNLNSALGSWTELKHDTILYSKQSAAEFGEGEEFEIPPYAPPSVKGYVEPNPVFFKRLSELSAQLSADLQKTGFLTGEYSDKLQKFDSLTKRAFSIAKKEVDGAPIHGEEYEWIQQASHEFNRGLLLPQETGDIVDSDLLKMALVADVATDYDSGTALEVAVGAPQQLTVVVKDASGGARLTTGYVYSWCEFKDTKRWTDGEWKNLVYGNDQKRVNGMRPAWYSKFQKPE